MTHMTHVEIEKLDMDVFSGNRKNDSRPDEGETGGRDSLFGVRSGEMPKYRPIAPTRILSPEEHENNVGIQEAARQDDALRALIGLGGGQSHLLFQRRPIQRGVGGTEIEWPELWEECHRVVLRHYAKTGDANGYSRTSRCMRECSEFMRHHKRRRFSSSLGQIPEICPDGTQFGSKETNEGLPRTGSNSPLGRNQQREDEASI